MNIERKFLNHKEIMDLTGFSKSKLDKLRMNKAIPYIKQGRQVLYYKPNIEKWLLNKSVEVLSWNYLKKAINP